jgi:hypothetical protein
MALFSHTCFSKHDDYMTKRSTWEAIARFIPRDKIIWECFYGDGGSGEHLRSLGFDVIHEPIDFFNEDRGEIIVSNPPFSMKKEVLQRLKLLNKPFIIISPISTLSTRYMRETFGNEIQIIVPRQRMQFVKVGDNGEAHDDGRCNFDSVYFCWRIGLDKDIVFL